MDHNGFLSVPGFQRDVTRESTRSDISTFSTVSANTMRRKQGGKQNRHQKKEKQISNLFASPGLSTETKKQSQVRIFTNACT